MFSVVHPFLTAAAKNVGFFRIPCMIQQKRREGDRMQERKIIALLRERDQQGLHALLVHDGPLCDTSSLPFCGTLRSGRIVFPR